MWQTFTREARESLAKAMQIAVGFGTKSLSPDHHFLAILKHPHSVAVQALKSLGHDPKLATEEFEAILLANPTPEDREPGLDDESKSVFDAVYEVGRKMKQRKLGAEHFLLAILLVEGTHARQYLNQKGITYRTVRQVLEHPTQSQEPRRQTKQVKSALDELFMTILLEEPQAIRAKLAEIAAHPQPIRNELMNLFLHQGEKER
ncbi:MAG TPA: Clp protease N-terminal domain-containing protein [Fimbriimonas sp.]|nr:Clp protease N-terminal domain-containing protein [Fimbriimonas sp.]